MRSLNAMTKTNPDNDLIASPTLSVKVKGTSPARRWHNGMPKLFPPLGNQTLSHPWSELTARLWRPPMSDKLRFAATFDLAC